MKKEWLFVGELVVYKNPHLDSCEVGRVASITPDGVFVCYSEGETAAKTPCDWLYPVTNSAMIDYSKIGGSRLNGCYI